VLLCELKCSKVYNKWHTVPRWQQAYGKSYEFSGNVSVALPISAQIQSFIDWANLNETNNGRTGGFNGALLNWYEDGEHHIGWHSDNEGPLVKNEPIYTISLGATRTFKIREKSHANSANYELENNNYLIMGGKFQSHYQHQLPVRKKCKTSRISITLRKFK